MITYQIIVNLSTVHQFRGGQGYVRAPPPPPRATSSNGPTSCCHPPQPASFSLFRTVVAVAVLVINPATVLASRPNPPNPHPTLRYPDLFRRFVHVLEIVCGLDVFELLHLDCVITDSVRR